MDHVSFHETLGDVASPARRPSAVGSNKGTLVSWSFELAPPIFGLALPTKRIYTFRIYISEGILLRYFMLLLRPRISSPGSLTW